MPRKIDFTAPRTHKAGSPFKSLPLNKAPKFSMREVPGHALTGGYVFCLHIPKARVNYTGLNRYLNQTYVWIAEDSNTSGRFNWRESEEAALITDRAGHQTRMGPLSVLITFADKNDAQRFEQAFLVAGQSPFQKYESGDNGVLRGAAAWLKTAYRRAAHSAQTQPAPAYKDVIARALRWHNKHADDAPAKSQSCVTRFLGRALPAAAPAAESDYQEIPAFLRLAANTEGAPQAAERTASPS